MTGPPWRPRAAALVEQLVGAGALRSPRWRAAFREVPRHRLVPLYYVPENGTWREVRTMTPQGMDAVYSNTALFTLPGGISSSSMPGLMARMLEALDASDGHDVLEIGTGAGYNAALLSHGLGSEHVSSVDVEPALLDLARSRLGALGYHPYLAAVDGLFGLPERAPFDRLIATCAVPLVPFAWVEQTREGGALLVDLKIAESAGNLVFLVRRPDGRAEGRFLRRWGGFMPLRSGPPPVRRPIRRDPTNARVRTTTLDLPRPWENLVFWFFAHLVAGPIAMHGQVRDETTGQPGDAFLAADDGSWCEVGRHSGPGAIREVREGGPRRLWMAVEDAHAQWTALGEPAWERFGVTVSGEQQVVWLDDPDGPNRWRLPSTART